MKKNIINCLWSFVAILSMALLAACAADDEELYGSNDAGGVTTLRIGVSVSDLSATRATTKDTDYEAYIDTYHLLLFDTDNNFITELEDVSQETPPSGGRDYYYTGTVNSSILEEYDNVKVVFIANWPYLNKQVIEGGEFVPSTIDNLVHSSIYSHFPCGENNFDPVAANTYFPFYGVMEFDDIHKDEEKNGYLNTVGLINAVRAYAKIEVIFDDDTAPLVEAVKLHGYATYGWCGPGEVYHQDDYKNGVVTTTNMYMASRNGEKDISKESDTTYFAYVGDYDNMVSTNYSYLILTIDGHDYNLYFANYTDGATTAYSDEEPSSMPDRLNIIRNNLYRFYVSYTNMSITVTTIDERAYYWVEVHESSTNATFTGSSSSGPGIVTN